MNISAWSFSRLKDYEQCPHRAYLKYIKKQSTAHVDKTAMDRGTMIHTACELYVKGEGPMIVEMAKHSKTYFEDLKIKYDLGKVELEGEWAFDKDWQTTSWNAEDVWGRMKLDNLIWNNDDNTYATITDYKSGKKFGNEVSHSQQGQIYALGTVMRHPQIELVDIDFLYLDHGTHSKAKQYTRDKILKFFPSWNQRCKTMTEATTFPPKANKINCKFCDFGPSKGDGSCEWGVNG